ncbi:MAG: hypothetical protein HYV36_08695 [Lentisphaerae bacterium]|nr:hypothetical protein [Lentisphaerota bacterium]
MIAKALSRVLPELAKRYGRDSDCTKAQLEKTCADLDLRDEIYPYLCAACLSSAALASSATDIPDVNWQEIRNRARRMVEEYKRNRIPPSDKFYESGVGMVGWVGS